MSRPGSAAPPALLALLGLVACSSPAAVQLPPLEVVVASGDGQYGTAGQTLGTPLRVTVRTLTGGLPRAGVPVVWEVVSGDASIVGLATTTTDTTGSTEASLRLGSSTGEVRVRAMVMAHNNPSVTLVAYTVDRPELTGLVPSSADPGASITLTGRSFSPDPEQNVVLFSGIRGRVTAASPAQLTVTVPSCLPARSVAVSVQLGVVASGTLPLSVGPGGEVVDLAVGGVVDVADDAGYTCVGLPGGGAVYLAVAYSASTVGAARHPFVLTGLAAAAPAAVTRPERVAGARTSEPQVELRAAWDRTLRVLESELVKDRPRYGPRPTSPPVTVAPAVGERRTFRVFQSDQSFTTVSATVQHVGATAALYVDEAAPSGGFTAGDLQVLADYLDEAIHPAVTGVFGAIPDLDGNERVAILFTPAVNALTPRGSSGFVGGFFFGIDLLPERENSNAGEVFYALVPDPTGRHSDPRTREAVMDVTPAVLAHELQHMVHFNERVLRLEAESTEAVWLSEGLAQYAEELVALAYDGAGDATSAELFRSGTRTRSRRYLSAPDTVSVIISTGKGSLAERGAGHLLVTYLEDQLGTDLLGRLTRTTRTGVSNVEAEVGRSWADVLIDWWSAVYLDGPAPESGPRVYPDFDLRGFLGDPFPLEPERLGGADFARAGALWSSSAAYYIVEPGSGGSTTVRVSGQGGAPSGPHAGLRMRIIRIS